MNIKKALTTAGALALFASPLAFSAESLLQTLTAREKAACEAFMMADVDTIKEIIAEEALVAEGGRLYTRDEGINFRKDVAYGEVKLSDFKVVSITDDVAILHMKAVTEAVKDGKTLPATNYVSTVWANKAGSWQIVYSTSYVPEQDEAQMASVKAAAKAVAGE